MESKGYSKQEIVIVCIAGILLSTMMLLVMSLVVPIFIINEYLNYTQMYYLVTILYALSAFTGGCSAFVFAKDIKTTTLLLANVIWYILIFVIAICLYSIHTIVIYPSLLGYAIGGGIAYLVLFCRKKQRIKRKKRGRRN